MNVNYFKTQDDRKICTTSFERWPERADTYLLEVVFEIFIPAETSYEVEGDPHFISFVTSIRLDTKEVITLTSEQLSKSRQAAMICVAAQQSPLLF